MNQPFVELKKELKKAQRQIDLLCGGFGVGMEPTWGSLLDKVLSEIKQWEDEGELREEKLEPVTLYYVGAAVTAAEGTPPSEYSFSAISIQIFDYYKNYGITST